MILAHAFSSAYKELIEEGDEEGINNLISSEDRHPNEDEILSVLEAPYENLMILPDGSALQIYDQDCLVWTTVKDFFSSAHWIGGEDADEALLQCLALAAYEKIKHLI